MRQARKASVMLTETIIGVIIGIVLLIFLLSIGKRVLTTQEDWEGSFYELAEELATYAEKSVGEGGSTVLKLEQGSAVIGLNPIDEEKRNGRFWDGDLHVITRFKGYANSFNSGRLTTLDHFPRPDACGDKTACLCLCEGVASQEAPEEYSQNTRIDPSGSHPYATTDYDDYRDEFLINPDRKDQLMITCRQATCVELEGVAFYSPNPLDYYSKRHNGNMNPIDYGSVIENGFAFHRITKNDKEEDLVFHYDTQLPATIPLYLSKLDNGELAVCIEQECVITYTQAVEESK